MEKKNKKEKNIFKQFASRFQIKSLSKYEPIDKQRSPVSPRSPSSQRSISNLGSSQFGVASKRTSSMVPPVSMNVEFEPLLPFKDVQNSEKMSLFISKLSLCCVVYDFTDSSKNTSDKDLKRATLIELVDFVSSNSLRYSKPAILAVCRMCAVNLFRDFSPHYKLNGASYASENDDDEPKFDPAWSHLQLVYDLLLNFVTSDSLETKMAKKYISHCFILSLLDLFDSDDPRERECLKTILHKIYGKFTSYRSFIRKNISNVFYRFMFEIEKYNGIAELLEIFGSVISGFALPLKEEHKIFLLKVLIPLHKPKSLGVYFPQLSYCIMQFIEKEASLASGVIRGLLKYWPRTCSQKEVMFLSELEDILETINMAGFQKVINPLFQQIRFCISSYHFQVAERALLLWNNDQIVNLIAHNRHVILPIIFPALENNVQSHWNQAVQNLSFKVRQMFKEMDSSLFLACHSHHKEEEENLDLEVKRQRKVWEHFECFANVKPTVKTSVVLLTPLAT